MKRIRIRRRFAAPPETVFDAWLDAGVASRWLFATASRPIAHAEIDPRVDGAFRFVDRRDFDVTEYAGRYAEIVPPQRLVFTLNVDGDAPPTSRVTVEIAARKRGCELTLTHDDVPSERAPHIGDRWAGILYGLGVTLDPAPERLS